MAGYQASPEEMAAAARRVEDVISQVNGHINQLAGQLEPLRAAWQGEAAVAFQGLMGRWHTDAVSLQNAMHEIGAQIHTAGTGYAQAEQAQKASMTSINSALG